MTILIRLLRDGHISEEEYLELYEAIYPEQGYAVEVDLEYTVNIT